MYRMDWDFVTPRSWFGSLAGEESLMGGRDDDDLDFHTTTILFVPSRSEDETMETEDNDEGQGDDDKMEGETDDDNDFFADLPLGARSFDTAMPSTLKPPQKKTKDGYSYYTYSYSKCTTLDDKGTPVNSTRRRYEDSAGRLKAVRARRIGDRRMESTWTRASESDEGKHDNKVSPEGDPNEFEDAWQQTPFGVAEQHAKSHGTKHQSELPDAPPAREIP
uniref:Uncharacterized protein n=1 Tax=Globisporangium ultimum (strain ATCC 200006 / CBS 805.95 / DAOM BR144) TaxID=431595 RepID=K3WTR8_GLOUD